MQKKTLLLVLMPCLSTITFAMDGPRYEIGINAYQPVDGFVNGSLRANTPPFLAKLRIGYTAAAVAGGEIQLHLDFQPVFKNNIGAQNWAAFQVSPDWVKSQHSSIGILWSWKYFGFGPEFRSESYQAMTGSGQSLDSVRLNRIWWRFSLGYISPPAPLRLVAHIELAGTNQSPSHGAGSDTASLLKVMAPDHEYGLYAGVKF